MNKRSQLRCLVAVGFIIIIATGVMVALLLTLIENKKASPMIDPGGVVPPRIATATTGDTRSSKDTTTAATTKATTTSNTMNHALLIVETDCGKVQGTVDVVVTDNNETKIVNKYIGIPYAVPPVGELRWKPPVGLSKDKSKCWTGILHANRTVACKQYNYFRYPSSAPISGQEDCLQLNVRSLTTNGSKLPVLVWIHGGALLVNNANVYGYHPNSQLSASLGVVSVSINYRLGPFGFLVVEELFGKNNSYYSNFGLLDQILALKWIKNNIAQFGGDPKRVTIFGQSGGGWSANALLTSPLAKNLFHGVISASSTWNPPSYQQAMLEHRSFVFASNCNKSSPEKIRKCLYALSEDEVIKASPWVLQDIVSGTGTFPNNSFNRLWSAIHFTDPVVFPAELELLPSLQNFTKSSISILLSNTAQESAVLPPKFIGVNASVNLAMELSAKLSSFSSENLLNISLSLYSEGNTSLSPQYIYNSMTTDVLQTCDMNMLAASLSRSFHVYRLIISQQPSAPAGAMAYHTFDTYALFGYQLRHRGFTPNKKDFALMKNIRGIFKQFIQTGAYSPIWQQYPNMTAELVSSTIKYINGDYHKKQCEFWSRHGLLGRLGRYQ